MYSKLSCSILITCVGRRPKRKDYRTRRNRTELQNEAWKKIYPALVEAYMAFDADGPIETEGKNVKDLAEILVVGTFGK